MMMEIPLIQLLMWFTEKYLKMFENIVTAILIRYENSLIQNYLNFSYLSSNISSNIAKGNQYFVVFTGFLLISIVNLST